MLYLSTGSLAVQLLTVWGLLFGQLIIVLMLRRHAKEAESEPAKAETKQAWQAEN